MASTVHPSFKFIAGPDVTTLIEFLLEKYDVVEPGTGTIPTVDSIMQDEGLQRLIFNICHKLQEAEEKPKKKIIKKKSSPKKTEPKKTEPKKSSPKSLQERNAEAFDECRCSARMWEAEKGLGYDNIQCSSCKKIPKEDAEDTLNEFKGKMNEAQLENMEDYLEKYDGCFCKNHFFQDFFMPNGYWLGKVNEDRPEKPSKPVGNWKKDGYQDDYKEHRWMYDADGNKVEKKSGRRGSKKKEEPKAEEPVELENVEVDDTVPEDDGAGTGLKPKEEVEEKEEEVEEKEEEVEEKDDQPYIVDGVEYTNVWDEEDEEWLVTYDGEHVGFIPTDGESGQINFVDEAEEEKHSKRVEEL